MSHEEWQRQDYTDLVAEIERKEAEVNLGQEDEGDVRLEALVRLQALRDMVWDLWDDRVVVKDGYEVRATDVNKPHRAICDYTAVQYPDPSIQLNAYCWLDGWYRGIHHGADICQSLGYVIGDHYSIGQEYFKLNDMKILNLDDVDAHLRDGFPPHLLPSPHYEDLNYLQLLENSALYWYPFLVATCVTQCRAVDPSNHSYADATLCRDEIMDPLRCCLCTPCDRSSYKHRDWEHLRNFLQGFAQELVNRSSNTFQKGNQAPFVAFSGSNHILFRTFVAITQHHGSLLWRKCGRCCTDYQAPIILSTLSRIRADVLSLRTRHGCGRRFCRSLL